MLNPPNVTPAVFEKFLPYAIALDCENQWSKKFEAEAAAAGAGADDHYGYTPAWYYGNNFGRSGDIGLRLLDRFVDRQRRGVGLDRAGIELGLRRRRILRRGWRRRRRWRLVAATASSA